MAKSSKYFSEEELKCHCGCGQCEMDPDFLDTLDRVRELAKIPIIISSGYRCPKHDMEVRGEGNHPQGLAIDAKAGDGGTRLKIVSAMLLAGINRIGIAKGFVHGDKCTDKPQRVIWLY